MPPSPPPELVVAFVSGVSLQPASVPNKHSDIVALRIKNGFFHEFMIDSTFPQPMVHFGFTSRQAPSCRPLPLGFYPDPLRLHTQVVLVHWRPSI